MGAGLLPVVLPLSPDQLPASVSIHTFSVIALFLVLVRRLGGASTSGGAVKG